MASEVAAPDPLRGSKPRKQVKDAGGIKAEAVADTQTTRFWFLVLAKIRSTRAVEWSENYTCGFSAN